jgi:transposase InsO family protein
MRAVLFASAMAACFVAVRASNCTSHGRRAPLRSACRIYVAAVVDLFSRRVVGWSMSAAMTAQLVTDALVMTIWRRGKSAELLTFSAAS